MQDPRPAPLSLLRTGLDIEPSEIIVQNWAKTDKSNNFKKLFESHQDGSDISNLYTKVKHQLGWTSNGPPQSLKIDGKVNSSSKQMTNELMKYFLN